MVVVYPYVIRLSRSGLSSSQLYKCRLLLGCSLERDAGKPKLAGFMHSEVITGNNILSRPISQAATKV